MIRLEKLSIRKLGNVAPNTDLRFGPRGALLLGKNGTGKTTLLNVIVAALRSDWPALLQLSSDGFDVGYTLAIQLDSGEQFFLDVTMKGDVPSPPPERLIRFDSGGSMPADYELNVVLFDSLRTELLRGHSKNNQTTIQSLGSEARKRNAASRSPADLFIYGDDVGQFANQITPFIGARLDRLTEPLYRFDEAYQYYEHLTDDRDKSRALLSLYYLLRIDGEGPRGWASPFLSPETARALRNSMPPGEDFREHARLEVTPNADDTAPSQPKWLLEFCKSANLDKLSINLELVSLTRSSSAVIAKYGPMSLHYSMQGAALRGEQLSFGQKRLFAILHYLDANPDLVVADELVNGLHHEWIERCTELVDTRQAFLSSQNPILFDFMYFESAEDAAARFIECGLDGKGRFVWHNMSLDDAQRFAKIFSGETNAESQWRGGRCGARPTSSADAVLLHRGVDLLQHPSAAESVQTSRARDRRAMGKGSRLNGGPREAMAWILRRQGAQPRARRDALPRQDCVASRALLCRYGQRAEAQSDPDACSIASRVSRVRARAVATRSCCSGCSPARASSREGGRRCWRGGGCARRSPR